MIHTIGSGVDSGESSRNKSFIFTQYDLLLLDKEHLNSVHYTPVLCGCLLANGLTNKSVVLIELKKIGGNPLS